MKTKDLFKGDNIYYRDNDLDTLFQEDWPDEEIGEVKSFSMGITFLEACEKYTGTKDEKELLKYSFTLPQIEMMTNNPKKYDLETDGRLNFFLVPSKNIVSVVSVYRSGRQWVVYVYRLARDHVWYDERRFFFRNLNLKPSDSLTLSEPDSLKQAMAVVKASGYKIIREY